MIVLGLKCKPADFTFLDSSQLTTSIH